MTIVGNNNLFLANSHVAHDCRVGDNVIMSNNVMLAGHVTIEDRAILGGGCAVHQFTRVGRHAFIGGLSAVSYDVIPYGMLNGNPGVLGGLNVVGMTRAGIERATIHRVRRAFKAIFEGEGSIRDNAAAIRAEYADCKEAMQILDFIAADSDRALSSPNRGPKS
jgi:UDP-N-acetylglucosamine acyltransferase